MNEFDSEGSPFHSSNEGNPNEETKSDGIPVLNLSAIRG